MIAITSKITNETIKSNDTELITEWMLGEMMTFGSTIEECMEEVDFVLRMQENEFYTVVFNNEIILEAKS